MNIKTILKQLRKCDLLILDDKGNLAVTTYVPDTILEFPENTFFDVLIDRLAVQLGSLNGMNNDGFNERDMIYECCQTNTPYDT